MDMRVLLLILTYVISVKTIAADMDKFFEKNVNSTEKYISISFMDQLKEKKRQFTLNKDKKFLMVSMPGKKGTVPWDKINTLRYKKISEDSGIISIIYTEPLAFLTFTKDKSHEFGVMPISTWNALIEYVGSEIDFELIGLE